MTRRIDKNWYEARLRGRSGIIPASYIEVFREPGTVQKGSVCIVLYIKCNFYLQTRGRCVAQLVCVLPSVLEVPSSIVSDSNVCSDFSLICVAVAVNTRKMEH